MIVHHVERRRRHHRRLHRGAARRARASLGVMAVDPEMRVVKFQEKPADPEPHARAAGGRARVDGHLRVQRRVPVRASCASDAEDPSSSHDFGKDVIPTERAEGQDVRVSLSRREDCARSTTGATSATSMPTSRRTWSSCTCIPSSNLYDTELADLGPSSRRLPPAKFVLDEEGGRRGHAVNSMVSGGCIISGAYVSQSLLFSDVRVESHSEAEPLRRAAGSAHRASLPHHERRHRRALHDSDNMIIGDDRAEDEKRFYVTKKRDRAGDAGHAGAGDGGRDLRCASSITRIVERHPGSAELSDGRRLDQRRSGSGSDRRQRRGRREARPQPVAAGRSLHECEECGAEIPEARRQAVPGDAYHALPARLKRTRSRWTTPATTAAGARTASSGSCYVQPPRSSSSLIGGAAAFCSELSSISV